MPERPRLKDQLRVTGTVMLAMVQRYGWRKTVWFMDFSAAWAVAVSHNNWEPIDVEQYGSFWNLSRAKAFRDQQRWREMVPSQPTPNDMVIAARNEYERLRSELDREPSRAEAATLFAFLPVT